ncbi:hypothetical protein [Sphingomonas trueperi]|uniref:hypothetical protein n=1 Tax=Sphingomonas trueperi TaxID=53317 RepID=UPI0011C478B8
MALGANPLARAAATRRHCIAKDLHPMVASASHLCRTIGIRNTNPAWRQQIMALGEPFRSNVPDRRVYCETDKSADKVDCKAMSVIRSSPAPAAAAAEAQS